MNLVKLIFHFFDKTNDLSIQFQPSKSNYYESNLLKHTNILSSHETTTSFVE